METNQKPTSASNVMTALVNHQKLALKTARKMSKNQADDPLVGMLETCLSFAIAAQKAVKSIKTIKVKPEVAYELAQMGYKFLAPQTFEEKSIMLAAKQRVKDVATVMWDIEDIKNAIDCCNMELTEAQARRVLRRWQKNEDANFNSVEKAARDIYPNA